MKNVTKKALTVVLSVVILFVTTGITSAEEIRLIIRGDDMGETRPGSIYHTPVEEKTVEAVKMLEELEPGLWLWVCHIGIDSPEQNALIHTKPDDIFPGGGVGKHRAAELDALLSIEVKSMILRKEIKLTNYRELWEEREK